jgi:hypothetical protein
MDNGAYEKYKQEHPVAEYAVGKLIYTYFFKKKE